MKNVSVSHTTTPASASMWEDQDEEDSYAVYLRAVLSQAVSHPDSRPRSDAELSALRTAKDAHH